MQLHNNETYKDRRRELRKEATSEEEILWQKLRRNSLGYRFRRQHSIGGYILDFYCFKARLIIEIDGKPHDFQKEYDSNRDEYFKILKYETIRIRNEEIKNNLTDVLDRIKKTLSLRARRGSRRSPG
ncbi:MAG: DUF559 domain-containing protein [Patescibacteria group bacterium]